MGDLVLDVAGVRAAYGATEVLFDVGLTVEAGEIVTLIGANGAGKSSTLGVIAGLLAPTAGTVRFLGQDITGHPAQTLVPRGLALVPEGRRIFPRMTVLENLRLGAFTRADPAEVTRELERQFTQFPILAERRHQVGGTLSGGEQQMLAIARALMSQPRLLLMDEPSMGVAPLITERIFATIRELNRQGLSILLVEQNATAALGLAHRGYVLETGRVTLKGQAHMLLGDPRVQAAYLGGA